MANKNEVKLTFAGDSQKLEQAEKRAGQATEEMADRVGRASRQMADDTGRAAREGEQEIGKLGRAMQGFGAVAAGAGAAAVASFTSSLEFDSARAKLDAQLGNSEFAAEAGRAAGNLYAQGFGENIGEMNEAVRSVIGSGALMEDATTEQIQSLAGQVHSLSEAFEQDLGQTMRAVGKTVKTGLVADAQEGLDVITRGLQQNVDEAGDLVETFSEYSTQFREVGLSGAQSMGLLIQGLRGGARDADVVADSIKEFTLRMKDGATEAAGGFKMLGLNGQEMMARFAQGGPAANEVFTTMVDRLKAIEDPLKRDQAALALFGTKAEDVGEALFALDPKSAADALGDVGGAAQRVSDTLGDTVENRVKVARREFEAWGASIAGVEGPIGSAAVGVMAFGTDALTMAGSLGMVVIALQQFGVFAKIATAAQWLWNAALAANPIGLIIIGIAALVAGFIWLWNNVEGFRNFWIAVWDGIVTGFNWVKDKITSFIDILVIGFGVWKDRIYGFMVDAGMVIIQWKDRAVQAGQWVMDKFNSIVDFFKSIPSRIGNALSGMGSAVGNAFTAALNWGIDKINWFVDKANSLIANVNRIPGVSLPSLPRLGRLHDGGVVPGFAGQERLAILEAGETVIPADKSPALRGAGAPATLVIKGDGSQMANAIIALIQQAVDDRGGDVQVVLGRS